MAFGSLAMWILIPGAWILFAAHQSRVATPTAGPLFMVLIGAPVCMLGTAKVLGMLDRRHQELTRSLGLRHKPAPWQRSLRDDAGTEPTSVLGKVMVVTVAIAFAALGVWFFFFAGAPGGGQVVNALITFSS